MSKAFSGSLSCLAVFTALSALYESPLRAAPQASNNISKVASPNSSVINLFDRQEAAVTLQQNLSTGSSVSDLEVDKLAEPLGVVAVTSVSQLSDVRPTDWAFSALQSLVERYGCIAGFLTAPLKVVSHLLAMSLRLG